MLMRIKGVKIATVRKGGGRIYRYYYHRATNTPIKAAFNTAAFAAEVAVLDARAQQKAPRDGSLGALILAYRSSPEFTVLGVRTKSDYDRAFDWLASIGEMPLH